MSKPKHIHTPGPWFSEVKLYGFAGAIVEYKINMGNKKPISEDEAEANAYLIASAPELLEAAISLEDALRGEWWTGKKVSEPGSPEFKLLELLSDAIKRARGA